MKQNSFKGKQQFVGTIEQQTLQKTLEKENVKSRINQVRMQEATISRNQVQILKQEVERVEEERQQQFKLEEYKKTQQLIQMLMSQKEKNLEEIGLAQKKAIQAQIEKEEKEKQDKIKQKELKNKQKNWVKSAVDWNNKENYEKQGKFKEFIQNKQCIRKEEDQIAKDKVEKYREELANKPQDEIQDPLNYEFFNKNISKKQYNKTIEYYANSHHHNPYVVKHLEEEQEDARELAEIERSINQSNTILKETMIYDQKRVQQQRGKEALEKIKTEKIKEEFEKEMEKLENIEKKARIEQGKANPDHNTKPLSNYSKQFRKQEDLEKAFQKQFLDDKAGWDDDVEIKEPQILKKNMRERQKSYGRLVSQNNAIKIQKENSRSPEKNRSQSRGRSQNVISLKTNVDKKSSKSKSKSKKKQSGGKNRVQFTDQNINSDRDEEQENQNILNKAKQEEREYEKMEEERRKLEQIKLLKQQQILNQQKLEDSMTSVSEIQNDDDHYDENQLQNRLQKSSNFDQNQLSTDKSDSDYYKKGSGQQMQNPFTQEIPDRFQQNYQKLQHQNESMTSESELDHDNNFRQNQSSSQRNQQLNNNYVEESSESDVKYQRKSEFQTLNQPDFDSSTSSLKESSKEDIKSYIKQQEEFLKKLERDREQIKNKMQMDQQKLLRNLQEGYVDVSSSESEYQQSVNNTDKFLTQEKSRIQQEKFMNSMGSNNSGSRKVIHSSVNSEQNFSKKGQKHYDMLDNEQQDSFSQEDNQNNGFNNLQNYNKIQNQNNYNQSSSESDSEQKFQYNQNNTQNEQRANQLVDQFLNAHSQLKTTNVNRGEQSYQNQFNKPITEEDQEESMSMVNKQYQQNIQLQNQQIEQPNKFERSSRFQTSNQNWKGSFGNSLGDQQTNNIQRQQILNNSRSPESELSYSLSEFEGSAEKTNGKNYKVLSFGTSSKNKQLLNQSLKGQQSHLQDELKEGTAKFGSSSKYGNSFNQNRNKRHVSRSPEQIDDDSLQFFGNRYQENQDNSDLQEQEQLQNQNKEISLADAFMKKKATLAQRHQEIQQQKQNQQQQLKSNSQEKKEDKKLYGGRTKEEILAQRKKMMQRPGSTKPSAKIESSQEKKQNQDYMKSFHDPSKIIKAPSQELMDRLAFGKKVDISKEEYQALTIKNYDKLPEVRKKKELEQKKLEYQERQRKIKEMDKKLRNKY